MPARPLLTWSFVMVSFIPAPVYDAQGQGESGLWQGSQRCRYAGVDTPPSDRQKPHTRQKQTCAVGQTDVCIFDLVLTSHVDPHRLFSNVVGFLPSSTVFFFGKEK